MSNTKSKSVLTVVITFAFVIIAVYAINLFNAYILPNLSGTIRLILLVVVWWPMLIPVIFFMRRDKENLKDIGFTTKNLPWQALNGLLVALSTLLIFVILPAVFGIQVTYAGNLSVWGIVYQLIYMLLAVAAVEEIVFRGYLFKKLQDINNSKWLAIAVSSILFGLFHIFGGSVFQIIFTTAIGFCWCVYRDKAKYCTLLSLVIGHALYNTIHPIFTAVYFGG